MNNSQGNKASLWDKIATIPQYLIPQHALSVLMHRLTRCEITWFKNGFIRFITAKYKVDINEAAQTDLDYFPSFNAFFTRELRSGVRPLAKGDAVITSPVDGVISQIGDITNNQIVQAKGREYSVLELLGGDEVLAKQFEQGQFATIYLSPRDYHRIHMPLSGTLQKMTYIPGKLFSVNPRTARAVPKLFARNERVVTVFETQQGPIVMVLVGAIFVGSMETVWQGMITPPYSKEIQHWTYMDEQAITLQKGEEMGRFNMGSTVVLLLPKQTDLFKLDLQAQSPVMMGQAIT
ncbi:MAG: archaetidylserine decarboxylase [Gammaproteobacteria bacterium]|nr:archaetidylserine decarboxylase [Gammaproteobacteria bacterium]